MGLTILSLSLHATPPGKIWKIRKYLDDATAQGLTGVSVYVRTKDGREWTATSGYSNIRTKTPMKKDDIFSLASIGKMYNAVAVLKLMEEGRIKLDDKMSQYLSDEIVTNLPNGNDITIKHLLAQTTGYVNYEHDPQLLKLYFSDALNLDTLSRTNALRRYVFGKPALFTPGERYDYSSTNYLLLALIVDKIVPEGHSEYLRKLLKQHGYLNTSYRQEPESNAISYYGDMDQNGVVDDLTRETIETTNWLEGDDGVYAPVEEVAHFLEDLMHGKILNEASLKLMQTWNNDKSPDYGLGLMADKSFPYSFLMGHSGRGVAVTTDAYYFPKQDMTVVILCNTGLREAAPKFKKAYLKMRTRIVKKLFLF